MIQRVAQVAAYRRLGDEYHSLTVSTPEIAEAARPGQFINIRPPEHCSFILRRPFSIYRVNGGDRAATVEVVFDIRGPGSAVLASLRSSDAVDIVGPTGRAFTIPRRQHSCLLVGGGVGATPLFFLADELRAAGKRVDILWGARRGARLVNPMEAGQLGETAQMSTEDGSVGYRGMVTDLLPLMMGRCGTEVIYACGPAPMLAAVSRFGLEHGIPVQVAMEELMGCGFGVCMSCVAPVWNREGTKVMRVRTCVDGPVFNGARVAWGEYAEPSANGEAPPGN